MIDSHAHLNFKAFKNDWPQVIERSLAGDTWMINVGSNYKTSKKALDIAEKYQKGIFAAIGVHPIHAQDGFEPEDFRVLACSKKVVAIGEIGLDYYKNYKNFKEKQKEIFLGQIKLAEELNLPLVLHCRKAHNDLLEIIKEQKIKNKKKLRGVVHCFTGSWNQAKEYLNMGFYLGFNGIIYKLNLKEVIKKTPLDRILIETDCPFLTPLSVEDLAEGGRNEPVFVRYIAKEIARIKNASFEQIAQGATLNTRTLFDI